MAKALREIALTSPLPFAAPQGEEETFRKKKRIESSSSSSSSSSSIEGLARHLSRELAAAIERRWQVNGGAQAILELGYPAAYAAHTRLSLLGAAGRLVIRTSAAGLFWTTARNIKATLRGLEHSLPPEECDEHWQAVAAADAAQCAERLAWLASPRQDLAARGLADVAPNRAEAAV